MCQRIIDSLVYHKYCPIAAEFTFKNGKRADLICRNMRTGKIMIFELKTLHRLIMSDGGDSRTQLKHLRQLCSYGIEWNNSKHSAEHGPCEEVVIHYSDVHLKPWISVNKPFWDVFAPQDDDDEPESEPGDDDGDIEEDSEELESAKPKKRKGKAPKKKKRKTKAKTKAPKTKAPKKTGPRSNARQINVSNIPSGLEDVMARTMGSGRYQGQDVLQGRARARL